MPNECHRFKVILADDEPIVLKALKVLIDWEGLGYTVCGEASDRKHALRLILQERPDVVITDLRMPGINGLALIQRCREEGLSHIRFVILSGYSDFQYAQQAIQYDVTEYLLKPVDEDALSTVLSKMRLKLLKEQRQDQLRMGYLRSSVQGQLKAMLLTAYLPGERQLQQIRDVLHMDKGAGIRYVRMQLQGEGREAAEAFLEKEDAFFFIDTGEYTGLIYRSGGQTAEEVKQVFTDLAQELYRIFEVKAIFMVGLPCEGLENLSQSGRSVRDMEANYNFYAEEEVWIAEEYAGLEYSYDASDILQMSPILEAVEDGSYSEVSVAIEQLFGNLREKRVSPELVKTILSGIVTEIVRMITHLEEGNQIEIEEYSAYINQVGRMTAAEAREKLLRISFRAIQRLDALRRQNAKGIINCIEKYVSQNYMNDINLKFVADQFHVNSAYLGQQFKRKTGIHFNQFLNQIRIEAAKQYLKNSDLRVYEIAEKVGFKSTDYFTRKFQGTVGQSPVEYREKCRPS